MNYLPVKKKKEYESKMDKAVSDYSDKSLKSVAKEAMRNRQLTAVQGTRG